MNHVLGARRQFLRGLQNRADRDRPRKRPLWASIAVSSCIAPQHNRRVHIMPAGMHHSVALTSVVDGLCIGDRQRIDVAPNRNPFA